MWGSKHALSVLAAVVGCALVLAPPVLAIEPSGTFIQVPGTAPIYRVIGGAAIHVDSCAPLGGCPGVVQIPNLDGYSSTPANGAFMRVDNGPMAGWIVAFVGGSYIHLATCAPLNGCSGYVEMDAGGASDYFNAHPTPANGAFMHIANGSMANWIVVFVGGSFIHVGSCAPLNGCPNTANVDGDGAQAYLNAHPTPANGSFVLVADGPDAGTIVRAAGGALIPLTDCAALGGCGGYVPLDAGGYAAYTQAHPTPADGTLLLGVPSNQTWEVLGGERQPVAASSAAVTVNDASLESIPLAPAQSSGSGGQSSGPPPPQSSHELARKRVRARLALLWRWNHARTQLEHLAIVRLPRHATVRISCRGRGCRRRALTARARRVRQLVATLDGRIYRAGDRITIELSAPRRRTEVVRVTIRYGRIPRIAVFWR